MHLLTQLLAYIALLFLCITLALFTLSQAGKQKAYHNQMYDQTNDIKP